MINITLQKRLNSAKGEMLLDIQFKVANGEFIALYGPSGAGKTSTLKMIAGLLKPDNGLLKVSEQTWFDQSAKVNLSAQKRNIGFVFQDYALFPNMTVLENLKFASQNAPNLISELITIMELGSLKDVLPSQLSGGQQQRVALARAAVQQPNILLLDEPLSAVDNLLRSKLQDYILQIHERFKFTTIMISHDQKEILKMANRCIILNNGKITTDGPPTDVFFTDLITTTDKLEAKIIHIAINSENAVLTIELQNSLIRTQVSLAKAATLNIGDRISLQASL